jgi:hypothetical protein
MPDGKSHETNVYAASRGCESERQRYPRARIIKIIQ